MIDYTIIRTKAPCTLSISEQQVLKILEKMDKGDRLHVVLRGEAERNAEDIASNLAEFLSSSRVLADYHEGNNYIDFIIIKEG